MEFCIECNKELNGKQTRFCSKNCTNIHIRNKNKNDIISSNKIFSENNSITVFPEHHLKHFYLITIDILSYSDKAIILWWQKDFDLKREYICKKTKCRINGKLSYRNTQCMALCLADIENIINKVEQRLIDTNLIVLKQTIKKLNSFRDKWIEKLKG